MHSKDQERNDIISFNKNHNNTHLFGELDYFP